jgi:hypothetical protein
VIDLTISLGPLASSSMPRCMWSNRAILESILLVQLVVILFPSNLNLRFDLSEVSNPGRPGQYPSTVGLDCSYSLLFMPSEIGVFVNNSSLPTVKCVLECVWMLTGFRSKLLHV